MSRILAAILGGSAGAVALVGLIIILIRFLSHKRSVARTSETGSSDPSIQVGRHVELSLRDTRHFEMAELSLATNNFSDKNLIGEGKFGEVYKGMLHDGMFVAIKKRLGAPSQDFIDECLLPHIWTRVFAATEQRSAERLEFEIRLKIAQGAAKGLAHLHSMSPRLVHRNFKTSNVLVDEKFNSKVADAGLHNVMGRSDISESSSRSLVDEIFLAPEVKEFRQFSEKSDVYSFGVFLLELVSGRQATDAPMSDSNYTLVDWLQNSQQKSNIATITYPRLGKTKSFTAEGMDEFLQLILKCVEPSSERRPVMSYVVMELERIVEKEVNLTTSMGEVSATVMLGSQLFKPTK